MRLYYEDSSGRWFGTAKEIHDYMVHQLGIPSRHLNITPSDATEVPTDKQGLIDFLNNLASGNSAGDTIVDEDLPNVQTESPKESWADKRERIFETKVQVEEYISDADYEEARRIQSLAAERLVEHVAAKRIERMKL